MENEAVVENEDVVEFEATFPSDGKPLISTTMDVYTHVVRTLSARP